MIQRSLLALTLLLACLAGPVLADPPGDGLPTPGAVTPKTTPTILPNGNIVVYRRVSAWELWQTSRRGNKLFMTPGTGEKFVSLSREYVDNLGARHPKDYEHLMEIELKPNALEVLSKIGLRAEGPLLAKLFPRMGVMSSGKPNAVHFKSELGVLNIGLRDGSLPVFNDLVVEIRTVKEARFKITKEADKDEKEKEAKEKPADKPAPVSTRDRLRRTIGELNKPRAEVAGLTALLERRVSDTKTGKTSRDRER